MADSSFPSGLGGGATLVVQPFDNLSGGGPQDYFTRGFVDDLITDLSRFPELVVIAGSREGPRAEEVDYALTGSLRRDAGRLRVNVQLAEVRGGRVIWAERLDTAVEQVFAAQDEITAQVVGAVSNRINASLLAAARRKPVTELVAYDAWLRGFDQLKQGTLAADEAARVLFQQALERDPEFARAHLGLSLTFFNEWSCQLWDRWDHNEQMAFSHAQRASELDDGDHFAHMVLGRILLFRREFERAETHLERSLALNRNDPDCLVQVGMSLSFLGRADQGAALYERATWLNPKHHFWYHAYGGLIAFARDQFAVALEHARRVPLTTMVDLPAHMAVAYLRTGDPDKAQVHVEHFLRQFREKIAVGREPEPGEALRWVSHVNPYRRREDEERLVEGLREAGLVGRTRALPIQPAPDQCIFRKVGSLWQLSFAGQDAHLPHIKGFSDIALLLSSPGREIHCAELMGAGDGDPAPVEAGTEAIDAKARLAYEQRIRDLQEELDECEQTHDLGRAQAIREELDSLVEHLGRSLGLGGRTRKLSAPTERARSAVTQRIRAAVKKIEARHVGLARHLENSIRTGTFCSYSPEKPLDWRL